MEFKRCSGILMPISSLPGGYGIGSMGKPARDFVDFLTKAGQTIWQILPVGPTGYADSPYQSCSAFAGNPYFIDLDLLAADGLLTKKDYANINWGGDAAKVDYGTLYEKRFTVLRKAYHNFMRQRPVPGYDTPYSDDWYRFQFLSSDWLPDYCLYMAIKEDNGMVDWQQWPRALRVREPEALARFRAEHAEEIEFLGIFAVRVRPPVAQPARLCKIQGHCHHGRYPHLRRSGFRRRLGRPRAVRD